MLPLLLAQIPEDELLHLVSADGAYDTKPCHEAIAHRHAKPSFQRAEMPDPRQKARQELKQEMRS